MFEFKSPPSQFRSLTHLLIKYGDWKPKYFCFEVVGDKQYLIVADSKVVNLFGKDHTLELINDIEVKGLVGLERPLGGVAYKIHKVLTLEGIKERSK